MTQRDLAEKTSIAKNTQLNYEKGARKPDSDYISAIAQAGVDVLYVLTGQRTPRKEEGLDEREKSLLDNYRSLQEGDKAAMQRLSDALAQSPSKENGGKIQDDIGDANEGGQKVIIFPRRRRN